jgi:hypothetical protein
MTQTTRGPRHAPRTRRHALDATLVLVLAVGSGAGCGREFFRNWADQDVAEAVFEKSRDPRFRLDLFSIEPPALSRFADPYDPDRPPAPPDDRAAEALSPVPQWPHHRLLVPVEGTGYADMLEAWLRQRPAPPRTEMVPDSGPSAVPRGSAPPPSDSSSPFGTGETEPEPVLPEANLPEPNSGTNIPELSPIIPRGRQEIPTLPLDRDAGPAAGPPHASNAKTSPQDSGVHLAALQLSPPAPGEPEPSTPPGATPAEVPGLEPFDAGPQVPSDPRLDLRSELLQPEPEGADDLASILNPGPIPFDEGEAAGMPSNSRVYVITPEQAMTLALVNNRTYQLRLEDVYNAGLAVTLQRFQFTPQFFAGLQPITPTMAGLLAPNPGTVFNYRTREAPGGQLSTLNIGTAAGVGKLLSFGTRIVGGFANQTLINFTGNNFRKPTVQSFLPLTVVQPFLRGGGRTVTLEALTQSERTLLYEVRAFARFRQQFMPNILASNQPVDQSSAGGVAGAPLVTGGLISEQTIGYLQVLLQLQTVENDAKNVAAFERILRVFRTLAEGEGSSVAPLDIIQIESQYQQSRNTYLGDLNTYRNQLDQFKLQLGLPPDIPLTLDRGLIQGFRDVFARIDRLQIKPRADLERLVQELPALQEVIIDGRPVLATAEKTDKLEDLLLVAERIALENRLDLMNTRAQLYDSWRQLAFRANALKGIFNLTLTNQFVTPPTTTNPFGFNDQAKQFSLVLNTELPLIRLTERNDYIRAHIGYQRQRRAMMISEDSVKFDVRQEVRTLQTLARQYEILKANFIASLQQNDQSLQNFVAPPASAGGAGGATGGGGGGSAGGSNNQTLVLIQAQTRVVQLQTQLIMTWVNFQTQRLILYSDLGIIPYDEWEAFYELFPEARTGSGAPGNGTRPPAPATTSSRPSQGVAAR